MTSQETSLCVFVGDLPTFTTLGALTPTKWQMGLTATRALSLLVNQCDPSCR